MLQLEFCGERDIHKIASVQGADPRVIPSVRERIHVPNGEDSRVDVRASSRQLYCDQRGHRTVVRLTCGAL
jgi:hypothetical protein